MIAAFCFYCSLYFGSIHDHAGHAYETHGYLVPTEPLNMQQPQLSAFNGVLKEYSMPVTCPHDPYMLLINSLQAIANLVWQNTRSSAIKLQLCLELELFKPAGEEDNILIYASSNMMPIFSNGLDEYMQLVEQIMATLINLATMGSG